MSSSQDDAKDDAQDSDDKHQLEADGKSQIDAEGIRGISNEQSTESEHTRAEGSSKGQGQG